MFLDGDPVGVLEREHHERALALPRGRGRLDLVVEDQGRVNYGPRIGEQKGLVGPALLGGEPLDGLDGVRRRPRPGAASCGSGGPARRPGLRRRARLPGAPTSRPSPASASSSTPRAWGKGIAWVNGFCLGRYWRRGPQRTLFVPGPVVRSGGNELVVLELDVLADPTARFVAGPSLGPLED